MYNLWHSAFLISFISHSSLVQLLPTSGGSGLIVREGGDIPKELSPEPTDDDLPEADLDDAIQDVDFDITLEELMECPDFDPRPPEGTEKARRFVKRARRKFFTDVLRNVRVNGTIFRIPLLPVTSR